MRKTCLIRFLSLALAAALPGGTTAQAEEVSRGTMLSITCAGCHGTDGKSTGSIPSIGGKSRDFIESSLRDFRSGKRTGTVMGRHATGYTDEEIRLIAEYFAGRQ